MPEQQLEQSYERDSRWKPHLSWSFLSWSLQQRMEEQAAQRELAWRKIADKLGPLLISDGSCTFSQGEYTAKDILDDDRAYERAPLISQKSRISTKQYSHNIIQVGSPNSNNNYSFHNNNNTKNYNYNHNNNTCLNKQKVSSYSFLGDRYEPDDTTLAKHNSDIEEEVKYYEQHKKAKRRCMTVSGVLISLIMLLFTIVTLMAFGVLHR